MRKSPVCGPARAESPASPQPRATPWVPFAHTFALTRRGRLCTDTQGAALGCGLTALSGRSQRRFELIDFLQRGCGLRRSSLVGLRRRNNELNELTNCRAARVRGIAPERGSYSRIGACPYLPPWFIDSRCCPCKGRISWAGLAPQHLSRYEPLTGRVFKIQKKSRTIFDQINAITH